MCCQLTYTILVVFLVWIMPLGAFINPLNNKKVCGGQRAICLCLTDFDKKTGTIPKMIVNPSPSVNKEAASPGGASHYFLAHPEDDILAAQNTGHFGTPQHIYSVLICKSIEHIPKV